MSNEINVMENNEIIKETVETGMEIATEVVKDTGMMKKFGIGAGLMLAGAVVCKGCEMIANRVIKPAFNKLKDKRKKNQVEPTDEKTEAAENIED